MRYLLTVKSRSSLKHTKVRRASSISSGVGASVRAEWFKNLQTSEVSHHYDAGFGLAVGAGSNAAAAVAWLVGSSIAHRIRRQHGAKGWGNVNCFHPISANNLDFSPATSSEATRAAAPSVLSTPSGGSNLLKKSRYFSDRNVIPAQSNLARFS